MEPTIGEPSVPILEPQVDNQDINVPEAEFSRFPLLPSELRLKIWRHALPAPLHDILTLERSDYRTVTYEPKQLSGWQPVTLLVNRESRQESMKYYKPYHITEKDEFRIAIAEGCSCPRWLGIPQHSILLSISENYQLANWLETSSNDHISEFVTRVRKWYFHAIEFTQENLTMFDAESPFRRTMSKLKNVREIELIENCGGHTGYKTDTPIYMDWKWWEDQAVMFFDRHKGDFIHGTPKVSVRRFEDVFKRRSTPQELASRLAQDQRYQKWRTFWTL